jgi:hypothetical protein
MTNEIGTSMAAVGRDAKFRFFESLVETEK